MSSPHPNKIYTPNDYEHHFNAGEYLQYYYSDESLRDGTRLTLFALPIFASTIRQAVPPERRRRLVDVGSGPTIYSAVCFRDVVEEVHLADYSHDCLSVLRHWVGGQGDSTSFNWQAAIRIINNSEGIISRCALAVEDRARELVRRGGIHYANIHNEHSVSLPDRKCGGAFDILVSVFCLESACANHDEYRKAVANMLKLLRVGGFLVLGTLVGHLSYNAGICRRTQHAKFFTILELTEAFVMECLKETGMKVETAKKMFVEEGGTLFLLIEKGS